MLPIVVLTATYNHPEELKRLYESLKNQKDHSFTWIIINDGSKEETRTLINSFINDHIIDIVAFHQENGGKSKAINKGIELLKEKTFFFVIVDDDEKLYSNAIIEVKKYCSKYLDTECSVIHFNRKDEKGNVIAKPFITKDFFMPYQQYKGRNFHADGYLGYFTKKLGNYKFNIFDGEKYIAPSTLFMKVTREGKLLWAKAVLGETEYLAGGITKQGRNLRIKNPQGMIEYCSLMQENNASLKTRIIYSIQGYAYAIFCKEKKNVDTSKLLKIMFIPGKILGIIWKKKYMSH